MINLRYALLSLVGLYSIACAQPHPDPNLCSGDQCDELGDEQNYNFQVFPGEIEVYADCQRIHYDGETGILSVKKGAVEVEDALMWSHPDASNTLLEYIDSEFEDEEECAETTETFFSFFNKDTLVRKSSSCSEGTPANVARHFKSLADTYFPDLICE